MKILDIFPITFKGSLSKARDLPKKEMIIQHDDGKREYVFIPDIKRIIEQFRWLSDQDKLRHLYQLEPDIETNKDEIADYYEMREYRALHSMKGSYGSSGSYSYASPAGPIPNPPDLEYYITWQFIDKDTALMFKLVFAGSI